MNLPTLPLPDAAVRELWALAQRVSRLNPAVPEIGAGMLVQLVKHANRALGMCGKGQQVGVQAVFNELKDDDLFVAQSNDGPALFIVARLLTGVQASNLHSTTLTTFEPGAEVTLVLPSEAAILIESRQLRPVRTSATAWLHPRQAAFRLLPHASNPYASEHNPQC